MLQQLLEHRQRQAHPGLTISRGIDGPLSQMPQMGDGGIEMEYLEDEELDREDGIELTPPPAVAGGDARLRNDRHGQYWSSSCLTRSSAEVRVAIRGLLLIGAFEQHHCDRRPLLAPASITYALARTYRRLLK